MPSKISVDQIAHSNETNALEIDTSGNVTIQQDLKFAGNAAIKDSAGNNVISESSGVITVNADAAVISGSSTGDLVRITQTGTGNALVVEDSANPDSSPFVVDASGNVGVGTSSISEKLEVNGRVKINASSAPTWDTNTRFWSESGFGARYDGYQHRFDVGNSRAEAMRINTSGNVGIGTDNPDGKLQINSGSTSLFRVTDSAIDGSNFNSRITKTSGNANDFKTPGFYRFDPAVSNTPSSSYHFAVIVFGNGNNVTSQIAVRIASTISYVRSFNTSWTSWARLDT